MAEAVAKGAAEVVQETGGQEGAENPGAEVGEGSFASAPPGGNIGTRSRSPYLLLQLGEFWRSEWANKPRQNSAEFREPL